MKIKEQLADHLAHKATFNLLKKDDAKTAKLDFLEQYVIIENNLTRYTEDAQKIYDEYLKYYREQLQDFSP